MRLTSVSSRRRHARLLGKVLGVVVVLVGRQSLSAAEAVAVRPGTARPKKWFATIEVHIQDNTQRSHCRNGGASLRSCSKVSARFEESQCASRAPASTRVRLFVGHGFFEFTALPRCCYFRHAVRL